MRKVSSKVLDTLADRAEKFLDQLHLLGALLGISLQHANAVPQFSAVASLILSVGLQYPIVET